MALYRASIEYTAHYDVEFEAEDDDEAHDIGWEMALTGDFDAEPHDDGYMFRGVTPIEED